jgi:hypothetical protein
MVAGVDGSNKTHTLFRAFLPSKQARAIRWVIMKALPTLIGVDTLKHVSVVASDQEDTLVATINQAIVSGIFPNAKHRFDYFHSFIIPWKTSDFPMDSKLVRIHRNNC